MAGTAIHLNAQTVTIDPSLLTSGYMNWTPVAGDATGYGGSGSSGWGVSAVQANFIGSELTINPNTNVYAPGNNYWVNADGSGANVMDANVYNETAGTYVATTLTFTFNVVANTLTGPYSSIAFIKDFAPNYSSSTESSIPLTLGVDTLSLLTSANPGDHIQFGFETFGPDAAPGSANALESVIMDPVAAPEPSAIAMAGLGGAALLWPLIRRRK